MVVLVCGLFAPQASSPSLVNRMAQYQAGMEQQQAGSYAARHAYSPQDQGGRRRHTHTQAQLQQPSDDSMSDEVLPYDPNVFMSDRPGLRRVERYPVGAQQQQQQQQGRAARKPAGYSPNRAHGGRVHLRDAAAIIIQSYARRLLAQRVFFDMVQELEDGTRSMPVFVSLLSLLMDGKASTHVLTDGAMRAHALHRDLR